MSKPGEKEYLVRQLKANIYYNEWIRFDCSRRLRAYVVSYDSGKVTCNESSQNLDGLNEAARIRNSVLNNGRGLIDQVYMKYASAIAENRSTTDFLADIAELAGGAAVGSIKGTPRALNLIGVFLTAFRGGRKSADLNFYREIPTSTLINHMSAARETVLANIFEKQKLDANAYDFDAALSDLIRYLYEGSLLVAVNRMNQDSAIKAQAAEDLRKKYEGVQTSPIISVDVAKLVGETRMDLQDLEEDCDSGNKTIVDRATARYNLIVLNLTKSKDFAGSSTE